MKCFKMCADVNNFWTVNLRRISLPIREAMDDGKSVVHDWVEVEGRWQKERTRKADLVGTNKHPSIAISERAASVLRPVLHKGCELLPVSIEGERLFCLYVTTPDDPLIWAASTFWSEVPSVRSIRIPVFDKAVIADRHIFRVPGVWDYFVTCEFKKVIEDAELRGPVFFECWTDELGGFEGAKTSLPVEPLKLSEEDRQRMLQTKEGELLLRLWEDVINRKGDVVWIEKEIRSACELNLSFQGVLARTLSSAMSRGIANENLAKWARGIAYSAVFALLVAMDEEGSYSRTMLSGLWRELSPECRHSSEKRRQKAAERIWTDAVEYFRSNEWWNGELQSVGKESTDFVFLSDPGRVMSQSLQLGMTESDWKAAAHALAFQVVRETLEVIDELEAFGSATLGGLHESLLMANPKGTA